MTLWVVRIVFCVALIHSLFYLHFLLWQQAFWHLYKRWVGKKLYYTVASLNCSSICCFCFGVSVMKVFVSINVFWIYGHFILANSQLLLYSCSKPFLFLFTSFTHSDTNTFSIFFYSFSTIQSSIRCFKLCMLVLMRCNDIIFIKHNLFNVIAIGKRLFVLCETRTWIDQTTNQNYSRKINE